MMLFFILLSIVYSQVDPIASVNILYKGDTATNGELVLFSRIEFVIDWGYLSGIADQFPELTIPFVDFEPLSLLVQNPDTPELPPEEVMTGEEGICPQGWSRWMLDTKLVIYNDWTSDTIMNNCSEYFVRARQLDNNGYGYLQDVHKLFSLVVKDPIEAGNPIIFRENYRFSAIIPEDFEGSIQIALYSYQEVSRPFEEYVVSWDHQLVDEAVDQRNVLQLGREETYYLQLSATGLFFDDIGNCDFYLRKTSETDENGQIEMAQYTTLWENSVSGELSLKFEIPASLSNFGSYGFLFMRSGIMDPEPVAPRRSGERFAETAQRILIVKPEVKEYATIVSLLGVSIGFSLVLVVVLVAVLVAFCVCRRKNKSRV